MACEILDLMEERRNATILGSMKYDKLNRKIRYMCRCAKEEWLNNECEPIEKDKNKEAGRLHQQINNIMGRKINTHPPVN